VIEKSNLPVKRGASETSFDPEGEIVFRHGLPSARGMDDERVGTRTVRHRNRGIHRAASSIPAGKNKMSGSYGEATLLANIERLDLAQQTRPVEMGVQLTQGSVTQGARLVQPRHRPHSFCEALDHDRVPDWQRYLRRALVQNHLAFRDVSAVRRYVPDGASDIAF